MSKGWVCKAAAFFVLIPLVGGGYGVKGLLHYPQKLGAANEGPLMILFIDEKERIKGVLPHLKEVVAEGLIVLKKVERA